MNHIKQHLPRLPLLMLFALTLLVGGVTLAATGYRAHNGNIRSSVDGKLSPYNLTTDPQLCEITVADGTGITFTTPTVATKISDATLTVAGAVRGTAVSSPTGGTCTIKKSGLYLVGACLGNGTGANTATVTLGLQKAIGVGAAAAISPAINAVTTTLTAQPWIPLCAQGYVSVSAEDAASTAIFSPTITGSTGNVVIKQMRFFVQKVDELDPAQIP